MLTDHPDQVAQRPRSSELGRNQCHQMRPLRQTPLAAADHCVVENLARDLAHQLANYARLETHGLGSPSFDSLWVVANPVESKPCASSIAFYSGQQWA